MEKTLILFDINGTLIKRDERTDIPFSLAIDLLFEKPDLMAGVNTAARSDKDVFIEVSGKVGLAFDETLWRQFLEIYSLQLLAHADTDIWRENADAINYVKALHDKGYALGLITGELESGAMFKLKKLDIWQYFPVGGFGDDGVKRVDIALRGVEKAETHYGKHFDTIVVIGDTLMDIETARHIGGKCICITTGANNRAELAAAEPDELVDWFREIHEVIPSVME